LSKKIGVLGCGWLGLPLARQLAGNSHQVYGTTTSSDKLIVLQKEGIAPYLISLSSTEIHGDIEGFLSHVDILIINVPPRLRGNNAESFFKKMELLLDEVKKSPVTKILFISSTSVYGDIEGEVTEETPPKPTTESGKQLLGSEELFKNVDSLQTTIIRFGGLIGPERHPVTMLSGRENLSNGDDPVNLIHQDDCIRMIVNVIDEQLWGRTFNGVYPLHPTKRDYYSSEAKKRGIPPPTYKVETPIKRGKTVTSMHFDQGHPIFKTSIGS
jgi:nucleoside-diphosphate-sugar epimerase